MPVGFFFAPYQQVTRPDGKTGKVCAMNDFTDEIVADSEYGGGEPWSEVEILGDYAIVKTRCAALLQVQIGNTAGFDRIPLRFLALNQSMGDLTVGERLALRNRAVTIGYTTGEVDAAMGATLPEWRLRSVRDFFSFLASRRNDGKPVRPLDDMEQAVR